MSTLQVDTSTAGAWMVIPEKSSSGLVSIHAGQECIAVDIPYREAENIVKEFNASLAGLRGKLQKFIAALQEQLAQAQIKQPVPFTELEMQLATVQQQLAQAQKETQEEAALNLQKIERIHKLESALQEQLTQLDEKWRERTRKLGLIMQREQAKLEAALQEKNEALKQAAEMFDVIGRNHYTGAFPSPGIEARRCRKALAILSDSSALQRVIEAEVVNRVQIAIDILRGQDNPGKGLQLSELSLRVEQALTALSTPG